MYLEILVNAYRHSRTSILALHVAYNNMFDPTIYHTSHSCPLFTRHMSSTQQHVLAHSIQVPHVRSAFHLEAICHVFILSCFLWTNVTCAVINVCVTWWDLAMYHPATYQCMPSVHTLHFWFLSDPIARKEFQYF